MGSRSNQTIAKWWSHPTPRGGGAAGFFKLTDWFLAGDPPPGGDAKRFFPPSGFHWVLCPFRSLWFFVQRQRGGNSWDVIVITTCSTVVSTSASLAEGRGFKPRRKRIFDDGKSLKKLRENERQERRRKTRNGKRQKRLFGGGFIVMEKE